MGGRRGARPEVLPLHKGTLPTEVTARGRPLHPESTLASVTAAGKGPPKLNPPHTRRAPHPGPAPPCESLCTGKGWGYKCSMFHMCFVCYIY